MNPYKTVIRDHYCSQCLTHDHGERHVYADGSYDDHRPAGWKRIDSNNSDGFSWYCESCAEEWLDSHAICDSCGDWEHIDDCTQVWYQGEHMLFCDSCRSRRTNYCDGCSEYFNRTETRSDLNGYNYCEGCAEDVLVYCESCDGNHHCDDEPCAPRLIHSYDYRPDCIFKDVRDIRDSREGWSPESYRARSLFAGFELEVESKNGATMYENDHEPGDDPGESREELAEWLLDRMPPDFVYLKNDGSINDGFEIVSHPFTLEWMREKVDSFKAIFRLKKRGARSYSTKTCGMHVHLSRSAFSPLHAFKMGRFFYLNPEFILWLSQRRRSQIRQWSNLWTTKESDSFKDVNGEERIYSDMYFKKKANGEGSRKYRALHWTRRTCELRIFRGNLNEMSFFKNLEFAFAAYHFTKRAGISQLSPLDFVAYLERNPQFPNLKRWIKGQRAKAWTEKGGDPLINYDCLFRDNAANNARNGNGEEAVRVFNTAPFLRGGVDLTPRNAAAVDSDESEPSEIIADVVESNDEMTLDEIMEESRSRIEEHQQNNPISRALNEQLTQNRRV